MIPAGDPQPGVSEVSLHAPAAQQSGEAAATSIPTGTRRATLVVTRDCNNRCVFCAQADARPLDARPLDARPLDARPLDARPLDEWSETLAALARTSDELTLVGGEPLLSAELVDLVGAARRAGFRAVGLQTNARMLASGGAASILARAGLTDIHVSIHGSEPSVHDYHTGVPGSFAQTLAGVAAARAAKIPVVASTVLTRSNYRSLSLLPRLLSSRTIAAWHLAVPVASGRADASFDRVVPRLGLAMPFALHAVSAAARLGLPAYVSGAPLCTLGTFAERSLPRAMNPERSYAAVCAECPARPSCPGVDALYLQRFAADELAKRAPVDEPAEGRFTRLFVGVGELAPRSATREVHEAPRAARLRLPVLARAQPGAAEARRAEPKTGDALREILPTLFEPKNES